MNTNNKRISFVRIARIIVQIIFFILLPGFFASVFSGIGVIYTAILNNSFDFTRYLPQLIEVAAVIPVTLLVGRFFCGWMCAFGALGDFLHLISSKVFKFSFRVNNKVDRVLKYLKFVVLGVIVILIWTLGIKSLNSANPWNAFGMLATFGKLPDISYVATGFKLGFVLLLAISIASLFIERAFCRYLCPLGATFTIISKVRFLKIKKPKDKCGNCRICTNSCPMGIPLYQDDKIGSGECILCLDCVSACPRENISVDIAGSNIKPLAAAALAVVIMSGIYYTGSITTKSAFVSELDPSVITAAQQTENKLYKDGTYQGTGKGFRGGITTVSVTVQNDMIINIEPVSYGDDTPYFEYAYKTVANQILEEQSPDVDAVSGATFSSNGITEAVADALSKAAL